MTRFHSSSPRSTSIPRRTTATTMSTMIRRLVGMIGILTASLFLPPSSFGIMVMVEAVNENDTNGPGSESEPHRRGKEEQPPEQQRRLRRLSQPSSTQTRQEHEEPQQQQQPPHRPYPDPRHLAQLVEQGTVGDRITIQFAPATTASNNNNNGSTRQRRTTATAATLQEEQDEVEQRAQSLLSQVQDMCHSIQPVFRRPLNERLHQEHMQAGLHYFYELNCPSSTSTTSTNEQPMYTTMTATTTTANVFQHSSSPPKKGETALVAINKIIALMQQEEKEKQQEQQQYEEDDQSQSQAPPLLNIERMEADHDTIPAEFLGAVEDMPEVSADKHPHLWRRLQSQQRQEQQEQRQRRRRRQLPQEEDNAEVKRMASVDDPQDEYYVTGYQSHYNAMDLSKAWEYMARRRGWDNASQVIAHVLDSGWDMDHEDSGVNRWVNSKEICGNGKDDDRNGYVDDCYGYNHADKKGKNELLGNGDHGSHVIGTIAANTDNDGIGVAGVAGGARNRNKNSDQNHRGVSIMTSVGFGKSRVAGFAESIVYAADMGADISSNSWGFINPGTFDPAVHAAIRYAVKKQVVVVFAAGNSNSNKLYYPAALPEVVAVSAVHNNGLKAGFSNYGPWLNIAAPGVNVLSTGNRDGNGNGNSKYKFKSGTSMACPHVAGVLAMGKSLQPMASASQLRSCLFKSAWEIDDPSLGAGMVNPLGFLQCLDDLLGNADTIVPTPTQSPTMAPTSCGVCADCREARTPGSGETGCACLECQEKVCQKDTFCCDSEWDTICAKAASNSLCLCTDDPIEPTSCEGDNRCGDCHRVRVDKIGCACSSCEAKVCEIDSYCCDKQWDSVCAKAAEELCDCPLNCATECIAQRGASGCPACPHCQDKVCEEDKYCCDEHWDSICARLAINHCQDWIPQQ